MIVVLCGPRRLLCVRVNVCYQAELSNYDQKLIRAFGQIAKFNSKHNRETQHELTSIYSLIYKLERDAGLSHAISRTKKSEREEFQQRAAILLALSYYLQTYVCTH